MTTDREVLEAQNEELQRIAESPLVFATFLKQDGQYCYVIEGSTPLRVLMPKIKLEAGDPVLLYKDTYQIVEKGTDLDFGDVALIKEIVDGKTFIVGIGGMKLVQNRFVSKPGNRVVLDKSGHIVLFDLGAASQDHGVPLVPNVTWDDIGGQHEAKQAMREAIEYPHLHRELYKHYNKKPSKGLLLSGPPGCGKTMFGKAAANALSKIYGVPAGFMYIKGPELMDKFFGESEAKVRKIFTNAREHYEKYGAPSVIFVDEADSLLGKRGGSVSFMDTIVTQFLTEMDGMEDSHAIVILATNRPDTLDPAVVREGRIDRKVEVRRPDLASCIEILKINLKPLPFVGKIEELAKNAADYLFATELVDKVSGAMIAGVVDRATMVALNRDIHTGKKSKLTMDDLGEAIESLMKQEGILLEEAA